MDILQLNIEDPNFASVVNQDGVFQIGKQVFKITNKYTYIFKNRDAFNLFSASNIKNSTSGPQNSYLEPTPCYSTNQALVEVSTDVYRAENCGTGGGGGGGYDPGDDDDDNSYPNSDVINLDPYANMDTDYASERTEEYHSSGTDGRLRGSSWNQNFYVFSSVGTKSIHERHTWGKWWDRSADKITLDAFIKYSYGEKNVSFFTLKQSLTVKLSDLAAAIDGGVQSFLNSIQNVSNNSEITRVAYDALTQTEFTVLVKKFDDDRFTYNIYPTNLQKTYSHTKQDAKRIRKVFDWSTAVVSFPPGIKDKAVEFKLEILRAKHTLRNDGYQLGFITDKRE